MNAVILKCPQPSKFRFGKVGLDVNSSLSRTETLIHSDTLFSAIVSIAATVCPDRIVEIISWFSSGEVAISSAFYCMRKKKKNKDEDKKEETYIYFLPKPACYELFDQTDRKQEDSKEQDQNTKKRKQVRKVKFVSKAVWEKGWLPEDWEKWNGHDPSKLLENKAYILDGKFVMTKTELEILFKKDNKPYQATEKHKIFADKIRPRITDQVRRPENNYYFQSELHLLEHELFETHWYFLLKADTEQREKLKIILQILADTGIGGRISLGCGQLKGVEIQSKSFEVNPEIAHSEFVANISLLSPASKEEIPNLKTYTTITRGGRRVGGGEEDPDEEQINHNGEQIPNILKRLKMLEEGAIIHQSVVGKVQDISPKADKSFLRYGKAFQIPIHQSILTYEHNSQA